MVAGAGLAEWSSREPVGTENHERAEQPQHQDDPAEMHGRRRMGRAAVPLRMEGLRDCRKPALARQALTARCDHVAMVVSSVRVDREVFERETGWALKPEGACRGDVCVPLRGRELPELAERLGLALVHDAEEGLWCLGPASEPVLPA